MVIRSQFQAQGPCYQYLGCCSVPILFLPSQMAKRGAESTNLKGVAQTQGAQCRSVTGEVVPQPSLCEPGRCEPEARLGEINRIWHSLPSSCCPWRRATEGLGRTPLVLFQKDWLLHGKEGCQNGAELWHL